MKHLMKSSQPLIRITQGQLKKLKWLFSSSNYFKATEIIEIVIKVLVRMWNELMSLSHASLCYRKWSSAEDSNSLVYKTFTSHFYHQIWLWAKHELSERKLKIPELSYLLTLRIVIAFVKELKKGAHFSHFTFFTKIIFIFE